MFWGVQGRLEGVGYDGQRRPSCKSNESMRLE